MDAQAIIKRYSNKNIFMDYPPTVNKISIRLIMSIAVGKYLLIFLREANEAYMSTDTSLLIKSI